MPQTPFNQSQGWKLLNTLSAGMGARIFTHKMASDAAKIAHIPEKDLNIILSRLARKGLIRRLRRGLYACTGLPGETAEIHPFVIATFLINPIYRCIISHWSALHYHGLTEQIPLNISASTTQRLTINPIKIDKLSYEFILIQNKHVYGYDEVWIEPHFRVRITDKERTLIDLFIYSKMFGGIQEAIGILEEALSEINIDKLIDYALKYEETTLTKRIGWALDNFGIPEDKLKPLLDTQMNYFCPLDPEKNSVGPCDSRWKIQNNLKSEYKK